MIALALILAQVRPTVSNWTFYGSADKSCGAWTADKAANNERSLSQVAWLAGFISGLNNAKHRDVLASSDMNGAIAFIDNWCANHPLKKVVDADEALIAELGADR